MYIPINLLTLVYYFQILFPVQRVANFAVIGSLKLVFSQKTNLLTCLLNDDVQFNTNEFPLKGTKNLSISIFSVAWNFAAEEHMTD